MPQSTHSESHGGDGYGRRGYAEQAGPPEPTGARRAGADPRGPADPGRGQAERPARSGGYGGYGRDGYEERPTPTPAAPDGYGEAAYGREAGSRPGRRDYPPDDSYGSGGQTLSRTGRGRDGGAGRGDGRAGYGGDGYDRGGYGRPGRDEAAGRHGQRTTDPYGYGEPMPEQAGVRHTPTPATVPPAPAPGAPDAGGRFAACPNCRTPHDPAARFCDLCGMDFVTGQIPGEAAAAGAAGAASAPQRAPAGYSDERGAGMGAYADDRGVGAYPDGGGVGAYPDGGGVGGGYPDERGGGYPAEGYGGDARRGASRSQNWEAAGSGADASAWEAVVEAERDYYDSGDDHRVPFPSFYPRRVFALDGPRLLVGRRSESRGIHPEIDLSGAPEDPGISRAHAMFEQLPDGTYAVLDPGSTNGTRLNDDQDPIDPGQPVPLRDGDRVYMGAWTRITLRAR
jgi:hypothetical protein